MWVNMALTPPPGLAVKSSIIMHMSFVVIGTTMKQTMYQIEEQKLPD